MVTEQLKLAQVATKIEAAHLLTTQAAQNKDAGERADLGGGNGEGVRDPRRRRGRVEAMQIYGGCSNSQDKFVVEWLYRDAPVLILGEGSNEIQQHVIARRLLERYAV